MTSSSVTKKKGNPAIIKMNDGSYDDLRHKQVAGEPATKHRATIRRQCKPRGPVGHLLESVHMQAASMDGEGTIWQYNQKASANAQSTLSTDCSHDSSNGHEKPDEGGCQHQEGMRRPVRDGSHRDQGLHEQVGE